MIVFNKNILQNNFLDSSSSALEQEPHTKYSEISHKLNKHNNKNSKIKKKKQIKKLTKFNRDFLESIGLQLKT